jgi:adenylate kinase family enzyme
MKIICVLGVGCVGKSTYCRKLLDDYKAAGKQRPLLLQLGTFFRTLYGPDFFKTLDNPTAPEVTEHWVRNNVSMAIQTCYELSHQGFDIQSDRDLVIDAVPRTKDQFNWLMLSSPAGVKDIPVEIHFLYIADEVLERRIDERNKLHPDEVALTNARMKKDLALHKGVVEEVIKAINEKKYPLLTMKEINY